jgi:hypothetical protein
LPAVQKNISDLKISDAKIYAKRLLSENFLVGAEEVLTRLTRKFRLDDKAGKGAANAP